MFVCINAGHDRLFDSGAVGLNGLREADVTYDAMLLVAQYLENAGIATLTVQADDLEYVCAKAYASNASLAFLELFHKLKNTKRSEEYCKIMKKRYSIFAIAFYFIF